MHSQVEADTGAKFVRRISHGSFDYDVYHWQVESIWSKYNSDAVFRDEDGLVVILSPDISADSYAEMNEGLAGLGYVPDVHFKWNIGYGDDLPSSITLMSAKMEQDVKVRDILSDLIGTER
jgi:hypothetical protein